LENVVAQRVAVRCIVWLDGWGGSVFGVLSGEGMDEQKQKELCANYAENQSRKSEVMQSHNAQSSEHDLSWYRD
jgi:hypothetical protein